MTLTFLSTTLGIGCSCECDGDCSFNIISNDAKFVALVKVVSYDNYLGDEIIGHDGDMPYSMTVEIIKKYKGEESRVTIKIWGDNGAECRPYISNFKIGEYYLIAPYQLGQYKLDGEQPTDYSFFICNTDFLKVNLKDQKALGEFTKTKSEIGLKEFEGQLKK